MKQSKSSFYCRLHEYGALVDGVAVMSRSAKTTRLQRGARHLGSRLKQLLAPATFGPITAIRIDPQRRLAAALILLALFVCPGAWAQQHLLPIDQATTQPDFFSFRAQLIAALARRDGPALLEAVHQNIKNSFGGNDGIDEFKQMWALDQPDSRLWEELAKVLALGGTFGGEGSFTAPYTFSRWPDSVDAFSHVAIVGSSVRVRSAASRTVPTVASLSYAIVEQVGSRAQNDEWVRVRLPGGTTGYVDQRYVRSPIDYRAFFSKSDGRWQMTAFVAGD